MSFVNLYPSSTMRSISLIAVFALTMVVCAEVTPCNSGAISLQTRSLRDEVHGNRFSPRRAVDNMDISANGGSSVEEHGGDRDQAPPSRKRKSAGSDEEASSTENGSGIISNRDQPSPGTRKKRRGQNGQVDVNHDNAGINPPYSLAAFRNSPSMSVSSQMSSLSLDSISLGSIGSLSMILKKALASEHPSRGTSPALERQNGQVNLNYDNAEKNPAYLPAAFRISGSSSVSSQMSSLSTGSIGSWSLASKKSLTREQPSAGASPLLRRQNGQVDLMHYNHGNPTANIPRSSWNIGAWGIISKKSSTLDQPSAGTSLALRKQNGQLDLMHYNHGVPPANSPASSGNIGTWL